MRTLIVVAALGIAASALAGPPIDPEDGAYRYREVVEVPLVNAAELAARARAWVERTYKSPPSVTRLDDAGRLVVEGRILAKGMFGSRLDVWHRVVIEAQDGRYRVTLGDFETGMSSITSAREPMLPGQRDNKRGQQFLVGVDVEARALLDSLAAAMREPTPAWEAPAPAPVPAGQDDRGTIHVERPTNRWIGGRLFSEIVVTYENTSTRTFVQTVTIRCNALDAAGAIIDSNRRSFYAHEHGPIGPGFTGTVKVPWDNTTEVASARCWIEQAR